MGCDCYGIVLQGKYDARLDLVQNPKGIKFVPSTMPLIKFLLPVVALIISIAVSAQVNQKKYDLFELNKDGKLKVVNRTL